MVLITIVTGVTGWSNYIGVITIVYGTPITMVLITIVTGANLNQLITAGASHCRNNSRMEISWYQLRVPDFLPVTKSLQEWFSLPWKSFLKLTSTHVWQDFEQKLRNRNEVLFKFYICRPIEIRGGWGPHVGFLWLMSSQLPTFSVCPFRPSCFCSSSHSLLHTAEPHKPINIKGHEEKNTSRVYMFLNICYICEYFSTYIYETSSSSQPHSKSSMKHQEHIEHET